MAQTLKSRTILITSGPTRAAIDAVRYLSNRSTGRLGAEIAQGAVRRGARVIFVYGEGSKLPDVPDDVDAAGLVLCPVETVGDVGSVLESELSGDRVDAVVHAMAVLDYAPAAPSEAKVASGRSEWNLRLVPTPKIIPRIKELSPDTVLVGFKLESGRTEDVLIAAAVNLAASSGAELVVANDITRITGERHPALLVDTAGRVIGRPGTKAEIAWRVCDWLSERLSGK